MTNNPSPHVLQAVACGGTRDAIEEVALFHARGLVEVGARVTTLAKLPAPRMAAHRESGATVEHVGMLDTTLSVANPWLVPRLAWRMRREGVRGVLIHTGKAYPLLRLAAPRGVPLISVCHGPNFGLRLGADIILCLNAEQEARVRAALGSRAAQKRILVLPNPSVLPDMDPLPVPALRLLGAAGRGEVVVGFLGQLRAVKGLDLLVQAAASLVEQGVNLRLRIGGTGEARAAMEAEAARRGITDRVEFLGWVEDRAAFFAGVDIFACPSREEPFGLVAAQAMLLGVPVVASDAAGFRAQITPNETGLLVPRGDAAALAAALRAVLETPEATRRMASVAQREAQVQGDRRRIAERILAEIMEWRAARAR